jgi:hypothetical protein
VGEVGSTYPSLGHALPKIPSKLNVARKRRFLPCKSLALIAFYVLIFMALVVIDSNPLLLPP